MKTVHEFFTNARIEDSRFEYSWFHSWMVSFARVESLRGRMGESTRQVEGLFESLLGESFNNRQNAIKTKGVSNEQKRA